MAFSLPKYKPQVNIDPSGTGVKGSLQTAGAEWGAVANAAGQAGDTLSKVAVQLHDKDNLRQKIAQKKSKVEGDLLEIEIGNKIDQAKNAYTSNLEIRKDYADFGNENDMPFKSYMETVNGLRDDPRLANHPILQQEIALMVDNAKLTTQVDAETQGLKTLNAEAKTLTDATFKMAIDGGNAQKANDLVNNSNVYSEAEKDAKRKEIEPAIQKGQATARIITDPSSVISDVNDQLAGKSNTFSALSTSELKSIKAYANQEKTVQMNKVIDEMYDPKSSYGKMTPQNKLDWLDQQKELGLITTSAYKAETKTVKEPSLADATAKNNSDYIRFQTDIAKAKNNPQEMAKVLDSITAAMLPKQLAESLYTYARGVEDPTSSYNQSSVKAGSNLIKSQFKNMEDFGDPVGWGESFKAGWEAVTTFGDTGQPTGDQRGDLQDRAEAEAQQEYSTWISQQEKTPTIAESNAKVYSIMKGVSERYAYDQLPDRQDESELIDAPVDNTQLQPDIAPQDQLPDITTQEEYDALPSGTEFMDQGVKLRKP